MTRRRTPSRLGKPTSKRRRRQLETAKLNLNYCTIASPIDGRAGLRLVDPGNVVTANSSNLLVVQKITPIEVQFTVPELQLDRVRAEMAGGTLQVQVHTQDDDRPPAEGELEFLDNSVQDGTGTVYLRALLENKDRRFWPGQFVQVRLILATVHDALLIPAESVQVGQQGSFVFILNPDGTAAQRNITPGQRQGDDIVIEKGLAAGETVIRSGQLMVQPGLPVNVTNPAATQPAAAGTADADPMPEPSHESLRAVYSPPGDDHVADGDVHPVWRAGVSIAAGERSSFGGLSGHSGASELSGRQSRDDGRQRRHAAGKAVHADSGAVRW